MNKKLSYCKHTVRLLHNVKIMCQLNNVDALSVSLW